MKVLYCESGSGRGGSAASLLQFLKVCGAGGAEAVVACRTADGENLLAESGWPVVRLAARRFFARVMEMRKLLKEHKPDILHTNNDIYSHIPALLAARTCGVPVVAHHRAVRPLTRAEKFLARIPARHVAVSRYVRDNLVAEGIAPEKVAVVYNAMETPDLSAADRSHARTELGLGLDARLVGCVGSLRPEKGLEVLVRAAALLGAGAANVPGGSRTAPTKPLRGSTEKADCVPKFHFVIVGSDYERAPGYGELLKKKVAETGLADRFHFVGYVADPILWIGSMDLLVFPTLLPEGFGRAALEGIACGVPVIASAIGAVPEIVEDGVSGRLVPPGDAEGLAGAIREAFGSSFGPVSVAERFGPAVQVAAILSIYNELLGL